jgi:signal transduction histidine kinase
VSKELDRLEALVENFFDVSVVEWQRLDHQQPRQDLRELASEVVGIYQTVSNLHQVSIEAPDQPVWVRFQRARLAQAMHAFVSNALELSPGGGVVSVVVRTEVNDSEERAVLTISNRHGAIPPDALHQLLDPLRPIRKIMGLRFLGPGTSVALSIARRIIEAHGGRVEAESNAEEGTTIRVRLPIARVSPLGGLVRPAYQRLPADTPTQNGR